LAHRFFIDVTPEELTVEQRIHLKERIEDCLFNIYKAFTSMRAAREKMDLRADQTHEILQRIMEGVGIYHYEDNRKYPPAT
jgi:hypothetical protein